MHYWTVLATLLVFVTGAGCSESPSQPPARVGTDAVSPPASQPPKSEAVALADALVEDLRRREAAQAKFDQRPMPAPTPAILPSVPPPPSRSITTPAIVAGASPAPQAPPPVAAAAPGRDEKWWKEQMKSLQAVLDAAQVQLLDAEKNNFKYGYNDAQAEYKRRFDAVTNARLAIDRLHDEARRAGVPPAWLR